MGIARRSAVAPVTEQLADHWPGRPSDNSLLVDLLQLLYRSDGFAVAESMPCRKSPAMLAATRAAETLTESRSRCA